MRKSFEIAGITVAPGSRTVVDLPMPKQSNHSNMNMPLHVVHGRRNGPVLFISAAIHGDELNGIEVIRRVLAHKSIAKIVGTLIAIPVVNSYGLIQQSRYLPDRRDLNRSFPGSQKGSLAARLAHLFVEEVVSKCTHGIDLHTGAVHRSNLPQIRADLDDDETRKLAESFGVPVLLNASLRDGSLRGACKEYGIPVLLYEAGEALRYDESSIRAGVTGVMNVMRTLGMLPASRRKGRAYEPYIARKSVWVRATESGMMRMIVSQGEHVAKGELLGYIDDPYSGGQHAVNATHEGVVIGRLELPMVHEGDAVVHIACFEDSVSDVADEVESFQIDYTEDQIGD
ncbi:succinylglutamate desuccinylase/aspartoacylase family protein [Neptunomonas phycophila]|uniref:succinylglutamate desuccinylase/aspartoacylase family protein n=1 Tax=Neptunomonas phycophila TaxID=1572645 RepID=UPI000948A44E|nr:succinylglutamate desuccinylase/aspartoacylase family protein [Neptunomonas phycophila]